ncbi:MAG: hypothetical protein EP343_04335 [Deltaproteobacteria bacterium]|nr:MAG: hypothetical protein EP343_04335 [Deltaproteobacteria bacterium]
MSHLHCPHCHAPLAFPVEQCPSCGRRLSTSSSSPALVTEQTVSPFGLLSPEREDLRTPYQGTPVPPTLQSPGPPSHTLEAPALPGEEGFHSQDTSSDSGWPAAASHVEMEQAELPMEDEFPTAIVSSEVLLELSMTESPPTVKNLSIVQSDSAGDKTLLHQPAVSPQESTRPTLKQPVPKAWSTPPPQTTLEKQAAEQAAFVSRIPQSEEALLPVEDDEATMLGHVSMLEGELASAQTPEDMTAPMHIGNWDELEQKIAGDLLMGDVAMVEVVHEKAMTTETPAVIVEELSPPTQATPALGPAMDESKVKSGEDTYDHLLHSLGVNSRPAHTLESQAVPAQRPSKGGMHTLEQNSLGEEPLSSEPAVRGADSFAPPVRQTPPKAQELREPIQDYDAAAAERRAVALRLKATSDDIQGSQSELIATPISGARAVVLSENHKPLDHRVRRALLDSPSRGQRLPQWLLWGGVVLLFLIGAGIGIYYAKYANPQAPSLQMEPLPSDPLK